MKVFGITGWKNSGKTSLVAGLVEHFNREGLAVSTIKHAHCEFDIDREGSDSYKHRAAGAQQVMIASSIRWALMHEGNKEPEVSIDSLLAKMQRVDIVLVEGFKTGPQPKIQVVRPENNARALPLGALPIAAVASNANVDPRVYGCDGPLLDLDNIPRIAEFILQF